MEDKEKEAQDMGECDEENEDIPVITPPPDGGWGWLIVFASFMCNVIVDGIIFSFGIFLMEMANAFGETKAKMAWVGSLQAGFYLTAGPIVSAFANSFGCRPVTIFGSILATLSFVLSFFATSMAFLCVTFGLLGGFGFGFIYLPAIVTVGYYFEKRRAFATGIAVCGSGIGAFIFAPFIQFLIDYYGWRGALLVLAGIILNCSVFGALFRPLEPIRPSRSPETPTTKPLLLRIKEARDAMRQWDSVESVISGFLHEKRDSIIVAEEIPLKEDIMLSNGGPVRGSVQVLSEIPEEYGLGESGEHTGCTNSPTESNSSPPPPYSDVVDYFSKDLCQEPQANKLPVTMTKPKYVNNINNNTAAWKAMLAKRASIPTRKQKPMRPITPRPFYRQDILFSASLLHIPEFRSQPSLEQYHMSITRIPPQEEDSEEVDSRTCGCSPVMKDTLKQMLDLSLLCSPSFLVLCASGFLTLAGFFVPYMFIVDRAFLVGISPDHGAFILSVIGITNTIGRVFCGWVSDRPKANALFINNCALVVGGVATALSPCLNTYSMLLVYGGIFGFSIACFAALRSIIIVDLLGVEKLTNAFGFLLLFQGIASIIGSPVAGLFYDLTGSYDFSFYIAGILIAIGGLMCFPLPLVARWEKRRNEARQRKLQGEEEVEPERQSMV